MQELPRGQGTQKLPSSSEPTVLPRNCTCRDRSRPVQGTARTSVRHCREPRAQSNTKDAAANPELSPTPKTLQRTQSSAQHQRRCSDPRAQPNTKDAAGRTRSGIILLLKDCLEVPQAWIHGSFPGLTETAIFLPCPESCSTVAEGRALEDPEEGCFLSVVLRAASSFRLGPVS